VKAGHVRKQMPCLNVWLRPISSKVRRVAVRSIALFALLLYSICFINYIFQRDFSWGRNWTHAEKPMQCTQQLFSQNGIHSIAQSDPSSLE